MAAAEKSDLARRGAGRLNGPMAPTPTPIAAPPRVAEIFALFFRIGAVSFGGGMSAWIRREVVHKRGWLEESQFLAGLAMSQIAPGANGVNIAVFVGAQLRGLAGASAAFAGLIGLPAVMLLGLGWLYFATQGGAVDAVVGKALAGVAAGATGLVLANGIRLARRNARSLPALAIIAANALALGVGRFNLLAVLAVSLPISLVLAWRELRR